jgi:sigma-B regulation protein RsbU (phosphoserine phosphatase)
MNPRSGLALAPESSAILASPDTEAGAAGHMTSHDGPWGIVIADASGHGPSAAVVMAMVHAVLHASPDRWPSPARALEHLNVHLHAKRIESSFVTAFFACYDPATHVLTYARAGHNPPLVMRPHGGAWEMQKLDAVGGLPLGVVDFAQYEETALTLAPGETLVLYTDGITDAVSPSRQPFGLAGLERSLTTCSGDPDCVIGHITEALREHEAGVRPSDDQTVVVMKVRGSA